MELHFNKFQSYYSLIFNIICNQWRVWTWFNFNPIIVLFLTNLSGISCLPSLFQSYYSLIFNNTFATSNITAARFQSYYSLIFNRPHFFSKRAKIIYNLFIHALKFVDYKKCFLFICINKEDKIIENKK